MLAEQKRAIAEKCLAATMSGDYKTASQLRQRAYSFNPPGTIGIDWNDWEQIWRLDSRYIKYLNTEDFSDVDNSENKIEALKAGLFVDYLFTFRDLWGVCRQSVLTKEKFHSDAVEKFLVDNDWNFKSENRELIYAQTKRQNISARMYYDSCEEKGFDTSNWKPYIYPVGEYYLGFLPGTPQKIINGRREWLRTYDEYMNMSNAKVDGFPKTFQTFKKHKNLNSDKYKRWRADYEAITHDS